MTTILTVHRTTAAGQTTEHHLNRDGSDFTVTDGRGHTRSLRADAAIDAVRRSKTLHWVRLTDETRITIGDPDHLDRADLVAALDGDTESAAGRWAGWDDDDDPVWPDFGDYGWAWPFRVAIDNQPVFAVALDTFDNPTGAAFIDLDDPTDPEVPQDNWNLLLEDAWDNDHMPGIMYVSFCRDGIYRPRPDLVLFGQHPTEAYEVTAHRVRTTVSDETIVNTFVRHFAAQPSDWVPPLLLTQHGYDADALLYPNHSVTCTLGPAATRRLITRHLPIRTPHP